MAIVLSESVDETIDSSESSILQIFGDISLDPESPIRREGVAYVSLFAFALITLLPCFSAKLNTERGEIDMLSANENSFPLRVIRLEANDSLRVTLLRSIATVVPCWVDCRAIVVIYLLVADRLKIGGQMIVLLMRILFA